MRYFRCIAICLFCNLFLLHSCNERNEDEFILKWAEKTREIECKIEKLDAQAEKMWDNTNRALEKALPKSVGDYEKENMLKVRNADLIRMFESYESLDSPIKAKVDLTEKMDFAIADSMRILQQNQKDLLDSIRLHIRELPSEDDQQHIQREIKSIQATACTKILDND